MSTPPLTRAASSLRRFAVPVVAATVAFAVTGTAVGLIAALPHLAPILGTAVLATVPFNLGATAVGATAALRAKHRGQPHGVADVVKSKRTVILAVGCALICAAAAVALPWLLLPALVAKVGLIGTPIDFGIGAAVVAVARWHERNVRQSMRSMPVVPKRVTALA